MKKGFSHLINSILGGVCIAIGGTVYLSCESKVVGALLFCLGLFAICTFGFHLFTGKVGYVTDNPLPYTGFVCVVWLGNLMGTALAALALGYTRVAPTLAEKAATLCQAKLSDGPLSIFLLSVFCGLLMFIAVDGFKNNPHELGKYLGIFLGVSVFILCGFEHCVANMFYFSMAGAWNGKALGYLLIMTLGNSCGGVVVPLCRRAKAGD